jgi:nitrate/nitrite transporter NarK
MRYLVLAFLCLVAVIAYVQRLGVQTADKQLQAEFHVNTEQLGTLGTAWLIGYAITQVPAGWLADRIGSRLALGGFAVLWSLLAGSIGLCGDFGQLVALWFAMGLAMGGVFPCAAKAIGAWFPDTEKATASGLLGSFTLLGTAAASFLTARLLALPLSWRWVYLIYGVVGVLWAVVYLAAVPERAGGRSLAPPMTRDDWSRLVRSGPLWFLCGQQFFRAGAMIFFLNWFPKFLRESRQFSETEAGDYAACVNLAALVGGVLGGFFSDWLLRKTGLRRLSRQGLAVVAMSAAGGLVLLTRGIEDPLAAVAIFAIGAFVATFGGVAGYTTAIEFGGRRIGLVFSLMNMAGNLGAALVNQAVGSLKERTGSWDIALAAIAVIFLVDAICWALLNPKEPLFEEPHETR